MISGSIPANLVEGSEVRKLVLEGIDEVQAMTIPPRTTIKIHGHNCGQWEAWILLDKKYVYVALPSEMHKLVNKSEAPLKVMAVKGHLAEAFDAFTEFFETLGFRVEKGSVLISTE